MLESGDTVHLDRSKRMKVGSHDKNKVKDRDLMHTIGGADLYDDENMIELGITSFLNDRWRMVMSDALSSGSFPIQVDDEHHLSLIHI